MNLEHVDLLARLVAAGLSDREIGEALDVSARTVLRWRKRAGLPSQWERAEPRHGGQTRYRPPYRCRCAACVVGNRDRTREEVRRANKRTALAPRYGARWTPDEDRVILLTPSNVAAALALGRTYSAVRERRRRITPTPTRKAVIGSN